jgi:hypothetical protein
MESLRGWDKKCRGGFGRPGKAMATTEESGNP